MMHSGLAGGGAPNYSVANNGSTVAEIYDPTKPIGQRWSTVADSQIWRMYHSSAYLTPNAEVACRPLQACYTSSFHFFHHAHLI